MERSVSPGAVHESADDARLAPSTSQNLGDSCIRKGTKRDWGIPLDPSEYHERRVLLRLSEDSICLRNMLNAQVSDILLKKTSGKCVTWYDRVPKPGHLPGERLVCTQL